MSETPREDALFSPALLGIALGALALRAHGLGSEPLLGDDVSVLASAVNFVERGQIGPTMWQHPRLRDLLVYAAVCLGGTTKAWVVLPSLVLGALAVPVVGLLGRRVGGPAVGLLAATLLALDPLHVGYSRQGVQEGYTLFFGALGVLLALAYDRTERATWLLAAGAAFGLGAASKWSVAFPAAATLAWTLARQRSRVRDPGDVASRAALALAALAVLPACAYVLSWAPWLAPGRDLGDLVRLHGAMAREAVTHAGFNPADLALPHRAALWFLWPTAFADFGMGPEGPVAYVFVANPLVWMLVLPAAWIAWRRIRVGRDAPMALCLAAFAAAYAPFLVAQRPIWLHSALAALPFAIVLVASLVVRGAEGCGRARGRVLAYVAATLLVATPLWALAVGHGLGTPGLRWVTRLYRPAPELERGPVFR